MAITGLYGVTYGLNGVETDMQRYSNWVKYAMTNSTNITIKSSPFRSRKQIRKDLLEKSA